MHPILFTIGSESVFAYGFFLALAFFSVAGVLWVEFKRHRLPLEFALEGLILALVGGLLGGKLFHLLDHLDYYTWSRIQSNPSILLGGAGSYYGGMVLGTLFVFLAARKRKFSWHQIGQIADSAALSIPLAYAIARIGCFLAGDGCYGKVCTLNWPVPFCMSFPRGVNPTQDLVYNTPLFESLIHFVFFGLLFFYRKRISFSLGIVSIYFITEGCLRFFIEFFRINPEIALGMSQAQWISLGLLGVGSILTYFNFMRVRKFTQSGR